MRYSRHVEGVRLYDSRGGRSVYLSAAPDIALENTAAPGISEPFTVSVWYYLIEDVFPSVWGIGTYGSNNQRHGLSLQDVGSGGAVRVLTRTTNNQQALSTTTIKLRKWENAVGVWAATNDRAAFLNGGGKGTNTANRSISTPDAMTVGNNMGLGTGSPIILADLAIWSVALSDLEVQLLASGISPLQIQRASLIHYYPFDGRLGDIIGGYDLSPTSPPLWWDTRPPLLGQDYGRIWLLPGLPPAGGQTVAIGQASETDTAQSVTSIKTKAIGQAAETDAAQAISSLKTLALAQVSETDTAQSVSSAKAKSIAQTAETDAALPLSWNPKSRLVNPVAEAASAQAVTASKTKSLAQTTESDIAQALTSAKAKAIGQAQETDLAQPISTGGEITGSVNPAAETDIAQSVSSLKAKGPGQASETDTAQAISKAKTHDIVLVGETDLAQALTALKSLAIGQASEADVAQALTSGKARTLTQAAELDIAQAITWSPKIRILGRVVETDVAQSIAVIAGVVTPSDFLDLPLRPTVLEIPMRPGLYVGDFVAWADGDLLSWNGMQLVTWSGQSSGVPLEMPYRPTTLELEDPD